MNRFGGNQCHLICITQEIRYHRTGQPISQYCKYGNQKLILTVLPCLKCSTTKASLMPPLLLRCQPTCTCSTWRNQTQIYEIKYTQCGYSVSTHYWLFLCTCCDHRSTNASPMRTPHIPDIWLETCGRYYLCEIGFLTVAGCLCLARFQWKLNLWKV